MICTKYKQCIFFIHQILELDLPGKYLLEGCTLGSMWLTSKDRVIGARYTAHEHTIQRQLSIILYNNSTTLSVVVNTM